LRHISALLVKYIMTAFILEIVLLLISHASFGEILLLSLAVTVITYIIGDNIILPATNNIIATIADMGLSLVIIYLFDSLQNAEDITFQSAAVAGVMLGFGEFFFHKIIDQRIREEDELD